jgi:hypothetical protein
MHKDVKQNELSACKIVKIFTKLLKLWSICVHASQNFERAKKIVVRISETSRNLCAGEKNCSGWLNASIEREARSVFSPTTTTISLQTGKYFDGILSGGNWGTVTSVVRGRPSKYQKVARRISKNQ